MSLPAAAAPDAASSAGPAAAAVHLEGLTKRYGDVRAVDELDLEIRRGEFFTMLGPSGSGKTTTLRLIGGFERPDAGRILLGGVDVAGRPPYQRDVNTVFQDYALFPHMTVAENVEYGLRVKGVARRSRKAQAEEALNRVRLAGLGGRKPVQLSGGQRQRVALARALVNDPQVLLLDEPLGALDLKLRQEMQVFLKALQQELGKTFVYVTHDQEEALAMSDRIAVFNQGGVEQVGYARRGLRAAGRPSSWPASSASRTSSSATAAGSPSGRRRSACWHGEPPGRRPPPKRGTIDEVVYLGPVTRYRVQLNRGGDARRRHGRTSNRRPSRSSRSRDAPSRLAWSPRDAFTIDVPQEEEQ